MKTPVTLFSLLMLLVAVSSISNAQALPNLPNADFRSEKSEEERARERTPFVFLGPSSSVKREPKVLTKGFLAPSLDDRYQYEQFLKQSKTGLIRLLPREVYDSQTYKTPVRIDIRGGGAYFSFFHRAHEYGYGSDLELDHNKFTVGFAGADYGMIVNLGDVPIVEISEKDPRFVLMSDYKAATIEQDARAEFRRFRTGVTVDGVTYRRTVPAKPQSTYLVRSIGFGTSDVLAAFRVVRFDSDGSAIIAWKLLKTFSTPQLKR